MRRLVMILSLLLVITPLTTRPQNTATISGIKVQKTIALIQNKNHYFIRVKLNNRDANMLVDTGSAASFLDVNQAKYYNFNYSEGEHVFNGVGGTMGSYRVTSYKFQHDTTMLKVYPFGADLEGLAKSFSFKGMMFTGILGSDFFERNDAIIDYKNKLLIIYE